MLNVYAPNDNSPQFMKTIFDLVLEMAQGILLIGGDFNCVLNPFLDKNPTSNVHPTMSRALKNSCEEFGLINATLTPYTPGLITFLCRETNHIDH